MKIRILAIGTAVILLLALVNANADSVYVGGNSHHTTAAHATNQQHQFFVYEHNNIMGGTFINSYGDRTALLGYRYTIDKFSSENIKVSFIPAVTYGYHDCFKPTYNTQSRLCPAVPLEIRYTKYKIQPTLLIIPQAVILVFNIRI